MSQSTTVPSFTKALFFGNIHEDMVFPYAQMDKDQGENVRMLLDSVKKFLTTEVNSRQIDEEHHLPERVLNGMKELGLFGLTIPEEYGGFGFSQMAYCRVMEEIASYDASVGITIGAHLSIGLKALLIFGTPEQKKKYLPRLATGEWLAAFALTEPGSGSDAGSIKTTAKLSPDGKTYTLTGSKLWITNGGIAKFFTVFAKTDEGKISAFIVERDFKGVSTGPEEHKLGIRGSSTAAAFFEDVQVPAENLIGEQGKGFKVAMEVLNSGRLGLATGCVGAAKHVMKLALDHAATRKQFNRPISEFGMIQDKLGHMMIDTYVMESMTYLTLGLIEKKVSDFSMESAICKVWCTEALWKIVNESLQIAAGIGYMKEYPYELILRDSRINLIFEGTNEILRLFIALSGVQGVGAKFKDFSQALRNPIKGFGVLQETFVTLVKPRVYAEAFTKEHPLLKTEAGIVEGFINNLAIIAEKIILKHGKDIVEREFAQKRLADVTMEIYAMVCVLSRVSQSIEKHGQEAARREVEIAKTYFKIAKRKVEQTLAQVDVNEDEDIKSICRSAISAKSYDLPFFGV